MKPAEWYLNGTLKFCTLFPRDDISLLFLVYEGNALSLFILFKFVIFKIPTSVNEEMEGESASEQIEEG